MNTRLHIILSILFIILSCGTNQSDGRIIVRPLNSDTTNTVKKDSIIDIDIMRPADTSIVLNKINTEPKIFLNFWNGMSIMEFNFVSQELSNQGKLKDLKLGEITSYISSPTGTKIQHYKIFISTFILGLSDNESNLLKLEVHANLNSVFTLNDIDLRISDLPDSTVLKILNLYVKKYGQPLNAIGNLSNYQISQKELYFTYWKIYDGLFPSNSINGGSKWVDKYIDESINVGELAFTKSQYCWKSEGKIIKITIESSNRALVFRHPIDNSYSSIQELKDYEKRRKGSDYPNSKILYNVFDYNLIIRYSLFSQDEMDKCLNIFKENKGAIIKSAEETLTDI